MVSVQDRLVPTAVISTLRLKVMGGYKPDLPSTVTQQHVDDAASDVVKNAKTLQEKNAIIQKHFSKIPVELNEEVTTAQVAAFERIVMARIGR